MWHLKHLLGIHFLNTDVASWLISMLHRENQPDTLRHKQDLMEGVEQRENKINKNKACTTARRDMQSKTNAA